MQAGQDPLLAWALPTMRLVATTIVARQIRGLHASKILEIKNSIMQQWLSSSALTVQFMVDGTYRLVDGMHRLTAVLSLIATSVLPPSYLVPCVVYRPDTPADLLLRHAAMVNHGNLCSALMTFPDKMRWIAVYMAALAPLYKADRKTKPKGAPQETSWFHVSAPFIAKKMQGTSSKECEGYSRGTCQRAVGVLRALRKDLGAEVEGVPLLFQLSTPFTDLLVMDQLGMQGFAVWFATFAHSAALAGEAPNLVVPGTKKRGTVTTWAAPMILNESTSYPKIFTHDPLDLPPWTQEVTELKLDNAAHFLMLRMYLGWLARTGGPATHDDGLGFLQLLLKNPRILVMWTQLRAIAEPEGLMAVTAAGFGLMAEHHGKDVMNDAAPPVAVAVATGCTSTPKQLHSTYTAPRFPGG